MMTWARFIRLFSTHFFSLNYQLRNRQEFLEFHQGDLSITEFNSTFRHLARHHEGIYGNQGEMMIQLLIAINPDYRELLASQRHISYEDIIETALRIEQTRWTVLTRISLRVRTNLRIRIRGVEDSNPKV